MGESGENGGCRVALATFPDLATARQIATTLVEEQLAACVNLLPGAESIYRWEGKVETGEEVAAILKTSTAAAAGLRERLVALHPYDVPEYLLLEVEDGHRAYLDYISSSCSPSITTESP